MTDMSPDSGEKGANRWTVQVDDCVGGWFVTSYPHPRSEHDHRPDGDPERRGYIFAECMNETMAVRIAGLLNVYGPRPNQMEGSGYWPCPTGNSEGEL